MELRMIKLIKHGNNATEIMNEKSTQPMTSVFFSYQTAVAGLDEKGFFRTAEKFSQTTTKQINKWLALNNCDNDTCRVVSQSFINSILEA